MDLRTAREVDPLVVDLLRPAYSQRWPVPVPPDPAYVRFEVTGLEKPFPATYRLEPAGPIAVNGDTLQAQFGGDLGLPFLLLEFHPQVRNTLRLDCKAFFQVSPRVEKIPLMQRRFETAVSFVAQKQTRDNLVAAQLRVSLTSLAAADPQRPAIEKQLRQAEAVVAETSAATERIEAIVALREALTDGADIHYRLFCLMGDCQVDLVRTRARSP